ncbi:hypothetical protein K440DRAFT_390841 [Wilcoxina mikolae CBS 423.85]|nr:hypothetical protein K440DRAFT_390841 [Wilcoxina mikolae CBS 423.85]
MASDLPPPSYPHETVPGYTATTESVTSSTLLESGGPATHDSKHSPSPKFYLQREETLPSRQSLIVTYSPDPALCRPVYTVKYHPQHMNFLPGTSQPDITVYRGADANGQVVATGTIKSSILGKTVGEIKMFGPVVETLLLQKDKAKAVWTWAGRRMSWNMVVSQKPPSNAAEHRPAAPAPDPSAPVDTSTKGKFKAAMAEKPEVLFLSYKGVLEAEPGVELAIYEDIPPHNPPMTRQLIYKDGHAGTLEFMDTEVETKFQDAAIAVLVLMIERAKKGTINGKSGPGFIFNPWAGAGDVGGGMMG